MIQWLMVDDRMSEICCDSDSGWLFVRSVSSKAAEVDYV